MTQEEKQLLLIDLCARLPYGVKIERTYVDYPTVLHEDDIVSWKIGEIEIKPYLRPLSSMTEEEEIYYNTIYTTLKFYEKEDWLNEHHFDYRGLIPMGLAFEAPEGMYKNDYDCPHFKPKDEK